MSRALVWLILSLWVSPSWAIDQQHAAWSALLARHVEWNAQGSASSVDYAGFGRDRTALTSYLDQLSAVTRPEFDAWSKPERRAFLINAYNAHTVELILTRYPKLDSIRDLGSWLKSPWKQEFFELFGTAQTLDGIEHGLLRGAADYDDPRIHFAVNCASLGCPALRPEAYRGADLDQQLQDQTQRFLRDHTRNRYDAQSKTLELSRIFDWYAEDFEKDFRGAGSLAAFLALYREDLGLDADSTARLAAGQIDIEFLDYDWALNDRRTRTEQAEGH